MKGYRRTADVLKALAHPARLQILEVLQSEDEACVCHLEARLGHRQAYISQQLARLRQEGLVTDRRDGLNVYYAIADRGIAPLIARAKGLAVDLAHAEGKSLSFAPIHEIPPQDCICPKCEQKVATTEVRAVDPRERQRR
jgi:DNA-binding transcriptional ArsR family regulator